MLSFLMFLSLVVFGYFLGSLDFSKIAQHSSSSLSSPIKHQVALCIK